LVQKKEEARGRKPTSGAKRGGQTRNNAWREKEEEVRKKEIIFLKGGEGETGKRRKRDLRKREKRERPKRKRSQKKKRRNKGDTHPQVKSSKVGRS